MHEYILKVNHFLTAVGEGRTSVPPELSQEFADLCVKAYNRHFGVKEPRKFSLRPSNVGRPYCQLFAEKMGWKEEPMSPDMLMKMYQGDIVEASAYITLKAAGVNVQAKSKKVSGELFGLPVEGELDVIIDGKIWDIKGVSQYAFDHKFSTGQVSAWVGDDDPFGYLGQGFAYSILEGKPFGGWIGICRNDSRWGCVAFNDSEYQHYADQANTILKSAVDQYRKGGDFVRAFADEPETFRRAETGNRTLGTTCSFCRYKWACWPDLKMLPQLPSEAKSKKTIYYTHVAPEWAKGKYDDDQAG